MKVDDVRTDWLRIPPPQPIPDSMHVLRWIDFILIKVRASERSGWSYKLSLGPRAHHQ
jgi:hypothetical protein